MIVFLFDCNLLIASVDGYIMFENIVLWIEDELRLLH